MNSFAATIPILIVVLSAIAAMLAEAIRHPGERMYIAGFGLIGLVGAAVASVFLWDTDAVSFGVVRADNFALFINIILCIIGVLTMLFSNEVVEREGLPAGEYYALTLFAISGMMLMAAATDLLVIFLALEVLSLAVYVLTGLRRTSADGAEAAFKYFLLGAFSSAFFLYGIAFAFLLSQGSTRLDVIAQAIASGPNATRVVARGRPARRRLLLQGLGRAVPHVDAGRLRRGADDRHRVHVHRREGGGVRRVRPRVPLDVRADAGAVDPGARRRSRSRRWCSARVMGVLQNNIKRMLAYSSIAHAGYLLLGIIAANSAGKSAVLFYLLTYAVANLGALGIVALLGTAEHAHDRAARLRRPVEDASRRWPA